MLCTASASASDYKRSGSLIGTWCDMQSAPSSDYVIEVWRNENGMLSYHILIRNGSNAEFEHVSHAIKEKNGKWNIESGHGEYAQEGTDGALSIYDSFGLITKAKPVPSNTLPKNCRYPNKKG